MDLKDFLYNGLTEDNPEVGDILIAEPIMDDTYFSRSVALLIDEPTPKSYVGLLLNKPTDVMLSTVMPEIPQAQEISLFCGGPVELDRLTLLHSLGDSLGQSFEILPGIYVGGELKKVAEFLSDGGNPEGKLKFLLGYSGWGEGQLQNEISRKSWALEKVSEPERLLRGAGIEFWRREVAEAGDRLRSWLTVPPHPTCN